MKLLDSPFVLTAGAPYDGSLRGRKGGKGAELKDQLITRNIPSTVGPIDRFPGC